MDAKITKLEREADSMAIVPPTELIPYLQGKKPETEKESKKIRQIHDGWLARILRALGRAKKDATQQGKILQEILNGLPEPYRTGVAEELKKLAVKGKKPIK
jgi:hypothetical protein